MIATRPTAAQPQQQGPQWLVTAEPAAPDAAWHNEQRQDAVPVQIVASLSPLACRLIAWGIADAIHEKGSDLSTFPEAHAEARALIRALEMAGDHGDLNQ